MEIKWVKSTNHFEALIEDWRKGVKPTPEETKEEPKQQELPVEEPKVEVGDPNDDLAASDRPYQESSKSASYLSTQTRKAGKEEVLCWEEE